MVALTPAQESNLRQALVVTNNPDERVRLAFAIWTESKARNYANGGLNTSNSPGFDTHPEWPAILRRSLAIPHDAVGNNGRSTGMLQQISGEVGGAWGSMAGTMVPGVSALRFLTRLRVTDNPVFVGVLQTPTGAERVKVTLSDPIAADVLRVQQPLASEALSTNYDASQVATARAIVTQLFPTDDWILDMADQAALDKYRAEIVNDITKYVEDGVVFRIGEVRADIQNAVKFLNQYIEDGVAFRLEEIKGKLDAINARLDALEANQ